MPYDYTDAPPPRDFDLIPHGTIATVCLHIRAGNVGEDGMLKRSKDGGCEMLEAEFTVSDGVNKGRKFWQNFILAGTTDGHEEAAKISRGTLKAILDSALNLKPDDLSPEARKARTISLKQFEGMAFLAKIGVEKGNPKNKEDPTGEKWDDKNFLLSVITSDKQGYHPVVQPPPFNGGGIATAAAPSTAAAGAAPIKRPEWSKTAAS